MFRNPALDFPELVHLPEKERKRVWKEACWLVNHSPAVLKMALIMVATVVVAKIAGEVLSLPDRADVSIGVTVGTFLGVRYLVRKARAAIPDVLADRGLEA